jgi:penicillin-binding protein 1A
MQADPDDRLLPPVPAWRRRLRRTVLFGLVGLGVLGVALAAYIAVLFGAAPSVSQLKDVQTARPSTLLTADGKSLGTFRREKQERVGLAEISPHVIDALIATEDHRFREHRGIDAWRTLSAVFHTATGDMQGGSTITQQLARNLFPEEIGRSRSLDRKLKEAITALRIERVYTKDEILETYLNTVPFFYNVVGIEMAARTYCDTSAKDLDELQSATLVGMLKGTQYYNPVRHPERAEKRRNVVLGQMARNGVLTPERLAELQARPLAVQLRHQPENDGSAPHFVGYVRKWLLDWAETHDVDFYADGLVIETTLDSRLQDAANEAVHDQTALLQQVADSEWAQAGVRATSLRRSAGERPTAPFAHLWKQKPELLAAFVRDTPEYRRAVSAGAQADEAFKAVLADDEAMSRLKRQRTRLEAGFLAMDPATGEVKAWVGSRDFEGDQFDHVAQAERQPGSTFKPFVYGAALEAGIGPDRTYVDGPVEIPLGDGRFWKPTDMAGTSGLPMTLRDGLVHSKNTITAQVMQEVGVARTVALAKALGVDRSPLDAVPSLALGTSPVTLLEMVNAYSSIAREGVRHTPVVVRRILDRNGHVLASFGGDTRRAMSPDAAVDLIDMMRGVVTRGTGTMVKSRFGITADVAGKTGTTQNNTDGWFVLMHPQLVAGAWVGFNDARVTIRSNYWGQGGHNAVLLVGDFFRAALKEKAIDAAATFPPPRHPPAPASSEPPGDWADDGGGEPGGAWTEGAGVDGEPPVNAVDDAASTADTPKNATELDPLLRLDGAKELVPNR